MFRRFLDNTLVKRSGLALFLENHVVLFAIVIFLAWRVRRSLTLRHFPGPALARFTSLWLVKAVCFGRSHLALLEVCRNTGLYPNESCSCSVLAKALHTFSMLTLGIHRAILTVLFMLLEGPLAVIGPNHLITDDPEVILRMNAARSQYGRSDWYKSQRVDPFHENMFSHRDLLKHDSLRRKVASGVSAWFLQCPS